MFVCALVTSLCSSYPGITLTLVYLGIEKVITCINLTLDLSHHRNEHIPRNVELLKSNLFLIHVEIMVLYLV